MPRQSPPVSGRGSRGAGYPPGLTPPGPSPRVVAFDPVGEITVSDRRARTGVEGGAVERAAAAERFAASFGLDRGLEPIAIDGRRTITITGQGATQVLAPRALPSGTRRRRDGRLPSRWHERPGFRGDRAALWAVGLGVLLILAAAASAHATTLATR